MAKAYQARLEGSLDPVLRMPLKGAKEGLVLTITSQDCIVHWPGSVPKDSGTQLVGTTTTTIIPYQEGDSIYDLEASTKIINNSDSVETDTDNRIIHAREVFMVRRPRSPLVPPEAPDIRSSDESESNISYSSDRAISKFFLIKNPGICSRALRRRIRAILRQNPPAPCSK